MTAAEVIKTRADASKPNMGLTTWKNSPKGAIRKTDVAIAKNYLTEAEITALNRVVTMYLDYAERQAELHHAMHMANWVNKLDDFLKFNEHNILTHAGTVSAVFAQEHAEQEFEKYETDRRRIEAETPTSDFDKMVKATKRLENQAGASQGQNMAPAVETPPKQKRSRQKQRKR